MIRNIPLQYLKPIVDKTATPPPPGDGPKPPPPPEGQPPRVGSLVSNSKTGEIAVVNKVDENGNIKVTILTAEEIREIKRLMRDNEDFEDDITKGLNRGNPDDIKFKGTVTLEEKRFLELLNKIIKENKK